MDMMDELESRSLFSAAPGDVGPDPVVQFGADGLAASPIVVDINRDGADDILIARNRRLQLYLNDGNGAFTKVPDVVFAGQAGKAATGEFITAGETSIVALGTWTTARGQVQSALRLLRFDSAASRLVVVDRRAMETFYDFSITGANTFGSVLDEIIIAGTKYDSVGGASVHLHVAKVMNGVISEFASQRPLSMVTQPIRRFDGLLTSIAAGDFSGDGIEDLALGVYSNRNSTGSVIALRASASRAQAFFTGSPMAVANVSFTSIALGQVGGDARADLIVTYAHVEGSEAASATLANDQGVLVLTRTGTSGWSAPQDAGSALATIPELEGVTFVDSVDKPAILSARDLNGDGIADFVIQKRLEWSRYFSQREIVQYKTTAVQVYLSGGGTWSERTAWSRNFASGNVFTPQTNFGSEPPMFSGLIRLRATDPDFRLLGSVGRDVLTGMTLSELAGVLPV